MEELDDDMISPNARLARAEQRAAQERDNAQGQPGTPGVRQGQQGTLGARQGPLPHGDMTKSQVLTRVLTMLRTRQRYRMQ